MIGGLHHDAGHAVRALAASPRAAILATLTLAVAIGANTSVFAVADALLFRSLAVSHPDRLMSVSSASAIDLGYKSGAGWSAAMWAELEARASVVGGALAWYPQPFVSSGADWRQSLQGAFVSAGFFETLGVQPASGRVLTAEDNRRSARITAVVSERLWRDQLGGERELARIGLAVNGLPVSVVGVMPRSFRGLEVGRPLDIALPLQSEPSIRGTAARLFSSSVYPLFVMIRLREGQSIDGATAALRALQADIVPRRAPAFASEPVVLVPAERGAVSATSAQDVHRQPVLAVFAGVTLLLFVACANLANLLLSRGLARQREVAIRMALGATRWRIWRLMIVDSLILASAGGLAGALLAAAGAPAIAALSGLDIDPVVDVRVLVFTMAITVTATLFFATAPAFRASGVTPPAALGIGPVAVKRSFGHLTSALVVVQVALAVAVSIAAVLLLRTLVALENAPLGFDADRLLSLHVDSARSQLAVDRRLQRYQQMADGVSGLPGVASAAASMWIPLTGDGASMSISDPRGGDASEGREPNALVNFVSPGWFRTYGISLRTGRDFDLRDTASSQEVVIVNEAFARKFFADEPPVGRTTAEGHLIVGTTTDAAYRSIQRAPRLASLAIRESATPTMYAPLAQFAQWGRPGGDTIRISARIAGGDVGAPSAAAVDAIAAVDPDATASVTTLADIAWRALTFERAPALLLGAFASLALLLATMGLYGISSHAVERRRREIGIRLALGASARTIARETLRRMVMPIGIGIVCGVALARGANTWLSSLLFGVDAFDQPTYVAVVVAVGAATALAVIAPAIRACRDSPAALTR